MWKNSIGYILGILLVSQIGYAQFNSAYIQADPFYLTQIEQQMFSSDSTTRSVDIRPLLGAGPDQGIDFQAYGQSSFYYNDAVPNLENTSELWVGKGSTFFSSFHLNLSHRNFFVSLEPYYQYSANLPFKSYHYFETNNGVEKVVRKFEVLNDGPGRDSTAVNELKFREVQLYIHKNGIGGGFANSGMWWGPGIQSSLNMTTNTTGIPRIILGTLREQRIGRFGLTAQYIFSKLDKNVTKPYFTATVGSITTYMNPIITLGASRSFISGGNKSGESISWQDAALLPIQPFFKEGLYDEDSGELPSDKTDQTLSIFLSFLFPKSNLKMFLEYGWNDHRWDWYDLRAHPDHSGASVVGFRKYGLFNNPNLIFGFEYANLARSQFYPLRATPDWYGRGVFDYAVYDGRRFAAHSGSDSDDMLVYCGYSTPDQSLMLEFNYERHGIIYSILLMEAVGSFRYPEDKLEVRLDYRKTIGSGQMYFYYEYEFTENLGSPPQGVFPRVENPERKANIFGLGYITEFKTPDLSKLRGKK